MSSADFDRELADVNGRLEEFRRRELRNMAQEILDIDRGINFSITMMAILWKVADARTVPGIVESRRVLSAHERWIKAGARQARRAG